MNEIPNDAEKVLAQSPVLAANLSNAKEFALNYSKLYRKYFGEDEEHLKHTIKEALILGLIAESRVQYKITSGGDTGIELVASLLDIDSLDELPDDVRAWIIENEGLQE